MSGNFWESSHWLRWTFTKEELAAKRSGMAPLQYARIRLLLSQQLVKFAARLKLRQRVVATAQVFLSRILTKLEFSDINIYLLLTTCVYIACRAEEQPLHVLTLCNEARQSWPQFMPVETTLLAECEFYVICELQACLVVHHAYTPLITLAEELNLTAEEKQGAWAAIDDCYATDIPLLYAPHVIALTAIYMVLVLKPHLQSNRAPEVVKQRLAMLAGFMGRRTTLDLRAIAGCLQDFVSLYALIENEYDAAAVAEEIKKTII